MKSVTLQTSLSGTIDTIEDLWNAPVTEERVFQPATLQTLPATARRYLEHAIAPGTRLASAVRLRMHGEIKLKRWLPFTAEQVIHRERGMIWSASVRMYGLPVRGSDRLVDGEGAMQWKLLGMLPILSASGPDITRSAIGRVQVEAIWLPSSFCNPGVTWTETDAAHPHACVTMYGETAEIALTLEETGRVNTASVPRWGNPEGTAFHYVNFGGLMEEERTFDGYTIPTRVRVGWRFESEHFEADGEFFHAVIDSARFR